MAEPAEASLSIGAVSRATGIPISTLRTWERRYGVPSAERSEANQRRYAMRVVPYLRLVAAAIEQGHRAAQVLGVGEPALRRMLESVDIASPSVPHPTRRRRDPAISPEIRRWLDATITLDARALAAGLRAAQGRLGLLAFLEDAASPFLVEVGNAWASGELQTFHEHFASEQLRDLLVAWWRPMAELADGAPVVCAGLPGEQHVLGLHMAAAVAALAGRRVVFVGQDTPLVDLRDGATQSGATAVLIGVSGSANAASSRSSLGELRRLLPASVALVVGGAGAPTGLSDDAGVEIVQRLSDLPATLRRLG